MFGFKVIFVCLLYKTEVLGSALDVQSKNEIIKRKHLGSLHQIFTLPVPSLALA